MLRLLLDLLHLCSRLARVHCTGTSRGSWSVTAVMSQVFDPASDKWQSLPSAPGPGRDHAVAAAVGDRLYIFGGTVAKPRGYGVMNIGTVEMFDTSRNTWTTVQAMPTELSSGHVTVVGTRCVFTSRSSTTTHWDIASEL